MRRSVSCLMLLLLLAAHATAQRVVPVELQPLAAQVERLIETLDAIGAPLSAADKQSLAQGIRDTDERRAIARIQTILDRHCLLEVTINPEARVRVASGAAKPELVQSGWRTFLVKVRNEAGVTAQLKAESRNALRVWQRGESNVPGGFSTAPRPPQSVTPKDVRDRWLDLSLYTKPPFKAELSGLAVEYRILQLYSRDAGRREARIGFNIGQGTQDIGFRNEADLLFTCRPAVTVTLRVRDERDQPTTASFTIRDAQGRVYPSPAKRLAPDFAFHPQVYRADGETIQLAAGEYQIEFTRGPEYITKRQTITVVACKPQAFTFKLDRWIDPASMGWYSGDHHIHAAGCSHYESPTEGVLPADMIRHVLGEDLKVGSVLTWGPCYYFQKQFFEARDNRLSTAENVMRYDLEVSGFPSSHAGHLVLLRLKDQNYPGTKELEDWPTWDLPILQWAKAQGAVVGFAHSGWGLAISSNKLPSYEVPKFDNVGANEYIVDVTHGAVDFISAVDTPPAWELNIWYHTLNCGFRTRLGGESDFPCIYGDRVGLGRSYVRLADKLSYDAWTEGLRAGRAYVTDGKSHLLDFKVNDARIGDGASELKLPRPATVRVTARVAARLDEQPNDALRRLRPDQKPYWELERARIGDTRTVPVELIVNGQSVARQTITADGMLREVAFDVPITQSSWVALRILPSAHTNPIFVTINDQPIRASRRSADWCLRAVDQCWSQKAPKIAPTERPAAEAAYEHARQTYRRILTETK